MSATGKIQRQSPWRIFGLEAAPPVARPFILLFGAVGVVIFGMCVSLMFFEDRDIASRFGIILVLYAATALAPAMELRRGDKYIRYQFWAFPTVIGVALGPMYLVPVAAGLVYGIQMAAMWVKMPNQRHIVPFAFGLMVTNAAAFGCLAIINPPWTYIIASVVVAVGGEVAVTRFDYLMGNPQAIRVLMHGLLQRIAVPVSVTALASLLLLIPLARVLVAFIPVTLLAIFWAGRGIARVWAERESWERMHAMTSNLTGQFEEVSIIQTAMKDALGLFAAERVIISVESDDLGGFIYSLESGHGKEIEAMPVTGTPDILGRFPELANSDNVRCMTLTAGKRTMGQICIVWQVAPKRFSDRSNLMDTFAHTVSSNLLAARTHTQVSRQAQSKAYEAHHDALTGLGNRAMLLEAGPAHLDANEELGGVGALLLIDLDGFKGINDTLGHQSGDRVLIEVARRFNAVVRQPDMVIRLGGDEFAILVTDMNQETNARSLATKLVQALVPPIEVDGLNLTVEGSIGIAVYGQDADDIDTLYRRADIAMYQAKALGRGHVCRYTPDSESTNAETLELATDLRRAIRSSELVLHYQPQIDIKTGAVVGMEALVRWNHPKLGMLYPDRFVPLAEQSALVRPFTLAITEQALRDRARIRPLLPEATVSVNLAARNLIDNGLATDFSRLMSKYEVDGSELVLEITETSSPADLAAADRVIHALAELGCQIAVDDFLTGYSTLAAIRRDSPLDEIKIDREFVKSIQSNRFDQVTVRSIIDISHARNCRVVAEGVEDEQSLDLLRGMGCDMAQGYLIAKPAPIEVIEEWVMARAALPVGT